jgi:hypothetical protein
MMEIEKRDAWQRHQLATVERVQKDLSRYTHPVISAMGLCGVAYMVSWAAVLVLGTGVVSMPAAVIAALTGSVVVLGAPALSLAVGASVIYWAGWMCWVYDQSERHSALSRG